MLRAASRRAFQEAIPTALLALALLTPVAAFAGDVADGNAPPLPCSDHETGFPSCGLSDAHAQKANALYHEAEKLLRTEQFEGALQKIKAARDIAPRDTFFATAEQATRAQAAASQVRLGEQAMQMGDTSAALVAFRHALELDPDNEYAAERLHDALPPAAKPSPALLAAAGDETRLRPNPGTQSFEFRGPSQAALEKFAALFGISAVADQGLTSRNVRIRLDHVDWQTGSEILQKVCKVLVIPLGDRQALVANDTEENRRDLVPMTLRTFYAQGGTAPQQLTDLTTALRVLFDLRFVATNPSQGAITIRAPQATMDTVARFLDDIQDDRPNVMLQIELFEVSTTFTRDLGVSVPDQFTVFNVPTEINKVLNGGSFQSILAALQASGQSVNAATILGALLATSSSSPLAQPFATFGGGTTLSAVTIPATSLHFSDNRSLARTVDEMLLRSEHGSAATMKVGERYPILTTLYSATSVQSSLLSSLGVNSNTAVAASIPSPQFNYEDLGLVLKATPQVHGKLISLDFELTVRALGASQANGPPVITNREDKGSISTGDGQPVVIAGLVNKSEMASISGLPVLSAVPAMGNVVGVHSKENDEDELLIIVTPHVVRESNSSHGIYVPLPMNVPK